MFVFLAREQIQTFLRSLKDFYLIFKMFFKKFHGFLGKFSTLGIIFFIPSISRTFIISIKNHKMISHMYAFAKHKSRIFHASFATHSFNLLT